MPENSMYQNKPHYFASVLLLLLFRATVALDIPSVYQCNAVSLSQVKNGTTYTKSFMVKSLHLAIDRNQIRIFGIQSGKYICQRLGVARIWADTLFLENPGIEVHHSALKLYFSRDTLISNVNLFESDTSEVSVKVLVRRLTGSGAADVMKECR
jgi:hypothetical protein